MSITTTIIDDGSPSVQYAGMWSSFYNSFDQDHTVHLTTYVGAQAIFKFRGSSVSVFGTLMRGAALTPRASYSVDSSAATILSGKPSEDRDLFRQHFYTSPELDPTKEHTLVITILNITKTAFHLDYFQIVQEEAATRTSAPAPNTPDTLSTQTATQSNLASSPLTITLPASTGSNAASPTFTSPTSTSTTLSSPVPAAVKNESTTLSSSLGRNLDPTQTATQSLPSSPLNQDTPSQSNSRVIGPAVGGAVGGLVLLIMLFILFCVLRRRAKAKTYQSSSRRATAFPSTIVGYQDIISPTTPTSASPLRQDELGTGYVVQGGHSKEKTTHRLPGGDWRQPNYQGRDHDISEALPAYRSELGDAGTPGSLLSA